MRAAGAVQAAVVRFAGMNCEDETLRALAAAGIAGRIVGWDEPPAALAGFDAYVLPGGFSYQDRVRAGAVAAKDPRLEILASRAAEGIPVLGICNGAQVLVEAGLVPGTPDGRVSLALAPNRMPGREGYFSRWITVEVRAHGPWTEAYAIGERVPLPMAHAEGRFTARERGTLPSLAARGQVPFAYVSPTGSDAVAWPENPNGSEADAAGVTNAAGNVLALMPHPERADRLVHVPLDLPGPWGDRRRQGTGDPTVLSRAGPGHGLFLSLALHLGTAQPLASRAS